MRLSLTAITSQASRKESAASLKMNLLLGDTAIYFKYFQYGKNADKQTYELYGYVSTDYTDIWNSLRILV